MRTGASCAYRLWSLLVSLGVRDFGPQAAFVKLILALSCVSSTLLVVTGLWASFQSCLQRLALLVSVIDAQDYTNPVRASTLHRQPPSPSCAF